MNGKNGHMLKSASYGGRTVQRLGQLVRRSSWARVEAISVSADLASKSGIEVSALPCDEQKEQHAAWPATTCNAALIRGLEGALSPVETG